ncbi:MAG TPA: 30S ribosomal protein S21 [Candidatus Paceibacterota bacterium]|nr:30S ribosomal protein S21 [Candidatus Paceibacterota bacterium]
MAIVIKRKSGESVTAFVNRANQIIKKSGILLEARKRRFYLKKPNERAKKLSSLHKIKVLKEIEHKRKWGIV